VLRIDRLRVDPLPPLSFEVPAGECLAIEGPSGCGKTRVLRAIADLDDSEGYVTLEGFERREMTASTWRRQIRFVASEAGWWGETGLDHFIGADPSKLRRMLSSIGLTVAHLDLAIEHLSTGERQRLALIRALMDEPQVLLLDEPTACLDRESAAQVEELIKFQLLSRRSVILVSHDPAQIDRMAHQKLILGTKRGAA
jgi:ABC-type iron transport system FetAB ATPase subunit